GNTLNLFDEILIEEGTAKEASYNELQAEYGKCQQQIKELMKKLKEIQAQNIILQNENQALKKNISALIKTARVEINRKDEEISKLHQRLSEFPSHRSFTRANLPGSANGRCSEMCNTKDYKFRSSDLGDSIKTDHRMKNDCSKDTYHSYSSHSVENGKSSSDKRNTPYVLRYPPEELCNDGTHICPPNHDHSSSKDNKKEKNETKSDEQYSRGNANKYKREVHQSTGISGICNNTDSEEKNSDPHQKLKAHSEKTNKNELQQKNQSTKVKCSPSAERKVEKSVSSWDKQTTGKERCQARGELYAGERLLNVMKKDIKMHDKDEKSSSQKIKPNEKLQEQSRRSGRGNSPHSKNEHSKSLHESRKCRVEESRTGRDTDCKRDRGASDHSSREGKSSPSNSSSREHKYARFKENSSRYEWETAHSKSEKHRTEEKRKRERENQDESRHSRSERKVAKDVCHSSAKKFKRETDTRSERNKSYKSEETPRVTDCLKDNKFPQTKNHSVMKSKDLKLSFMEKLNLTLSPAKKQCLSPAGGLKAPSQEATDEGTTELTLHADVVDAACPVNCDLIPEGTVVVCPSKNLSKEVNKENQKPPSLSDARLEIESQLSISSDEIEEGEIISSDEDEEKSKSEGRSENPKKSRPKPSPETRNLTSSPQNQKNKTIHCNEDNGKNVSVKVSTKNRERHKNQTFSSSKEMKKNKTVSITCLEKIVQVIVEPSNVQEIMQMLRAIRKQMRKSYMKFKVHFPVQHFHRIIESAIINFTSLIKHLNFSKMSTSGETLKLNICDIMESKLKQVKKNAIVDRLFEQQVLDMKKRLWKFVDEQLDYLFEKVKRIIVKQCDVIKLGNESEEGKLERTGKQNHKISPKNDVQTSRKKSLKVRSQKPQEYILSKQSVDYQRPKCHHEKNKTDAPKAAFTKCLNSIDNTRNSQNKVQPTKENNLQYAVTPLKGVKPEKEGFQQFRDANKSDLSYDLLTEQQASTLTFNLVSDAQMGEIFKSLLQGSDLLEKNGSNIDRHDWEFRTPEKQFSDNHKCKTNTSELVQRIAPKEVHVESRSIEDISWAVVSPIRAPSLTSRLQMSVDPDVLDESCMFEVPTSATSCREDEYSLQKSKSFVSSILLEDLAVSLTIPSPLKSDAHLSFLKSENNPSSTPECVLSAHYSEDALLEGEDATEQNIHLALESDNSSSRSSCSSSWTSRPVIPGFQCRSSLPMQAVIMEKSNDHFIVKIRRAMPSITPASDQTALLKEARASSTKNEKEEMRNGGKGRDRRSAIAPTLQEAVKPDLLKMDQLPYVSIRKEQNPALPHPLKESQSSAGKEETTILLGPHKKPSGVHTCDTESLGEGSEQPQTHKLEVSENTDGTSVGSQASFPVGCSVASDLTDESVKKSLCFAVESAANKRSQQVSTGNSEIRGKKEMEKCSDAFIDLTEDLSNETIAGECNLEEKSTSDTDGGCQISIDDKTSKKRKKGTVEENSNLKRQRKEAESADEGSSGSDVKSEGINSGQKQCHSKNNVLHQNKDSSPLPSGASSPGLYAKNIIKKKGEVVVSWTRNDDREILLECQRKGPSSKTFVSLATRLNKSPNQVSERFKQLMKLFKKSKCK
uniref:CASP8-associated protein 2 n=1 Tax=Coturnix japonica TaxID=93934 RepID=A0A8C2SSS6_COTJA